MQSREAGIVSSVKLKKAMYTALATIALLPGVCQADEILIAVASNFAEPIAEIITHFEQDTGHSVDMATGSSGRFYAQIVNGAPFQIFFSADQEKIDQLQSASLIAESYRFTYAIGKLALWSSDSEFPITELEDLRATEINRLAIANPRVAPYGSAAIETLESLGVNHELQSRVVQGENIAQTIQFVDTGNAEIGFVALSQVFRNGAFIKGRGVVVPEEMHQPIRQDVALLAAAEDCGVCIQFLDYIQSEEGAELIASYGYGVLDP